MTPEPSPLNDLRSDGIRLETIDLSTVPPERLVAMIADLANRATAEKARADRLEAERDEEVEALHAKIRALALHETCGCSIDKPGDVCLHHSPALVAAETRADRLGVELAAARAVDVSAIVMATLKISAPGLSQPIREGIARSIAMKVRAALTSPEGDKP